jgi:malate synthase
MAGMAEPAGVELTGPVNDRFDEILTPDALTFLATLQREFGIRRGELLGLRAERQEELSRGGTLDFSPESADVRQDDTWRVADPAPGLEDRRVEITGPTDRKMTINALNSGAKVWLADFEDANTPLWENMVGGQLNLRDALDRKLDFEIGDKAYKLRPDEELATIVVRPRGWHLEEKHVLVDGERMSASLFDFGLYFFHCARRQLDKGKGPYYYLPKIESRHEARLWNDVFNLA